MISSTARRRARRFQASLSSSVRKLRVKMSTALEVTGFLLGVASWLITGAALANDYWKVSSFSGSVIISNRQYENLWHACAESSTGIAECRDFESVLALPGERALHSQSHLGQRGLRVERLYLNKSFLENVTEDKSAKK